MMEAMFVKPDTRSPLVALAIARATHDEAARRMMKAAQFHLREAAKLDRQLEEVADADQPEAGAARAR